MTNRLYNQKSVASSQYTSVNQDRGKFTYKGFSSNNANKKFKLFDIDIVKQDIINHFYIRKGEKLENPEFGTIIWDMLFEQFTEDVKRTIADDVEGIVNYDPRVSVNAVSVDSTDFGIRIEMDVTYIPFDINEKMTFDFDRNNGIVN